MPPRLIINADDFGLTPGINRAVVELHRAGAVTSATLMANGPAFADAVHQAASEPGLGVGCHLVFVDGMPVSHPESIPTLLGADGKTFRPSLLDFAQAVLRGTVRADDVARETQAQIQKLQRAGIDVTHVDTHKHTHVFPVVAKTVLHIAQRCGVNAIRNPFEPEWSRVASNRASSMLRRLQVAALNRFEPEFNDLMQRAGAVSTTAGTLGINATGNVEETILSALLEDRGDEFLEDKVFELCCHPGYLDDALMQCATRLQASREVELEALLHFVPAMQLQPNPPALIHYGNLGIPGHQRSAGHFTPNTGYEKVL